MKNEREFRTLEIQFRKADTSEVTEEKSYIVEGYATTFNETYELYREGNYIIKEYVAPEAFANADLSDVVFQINHTGRVYARTRNNSVFLEVDDHGLRHRTNLGLTSSSKSVFEDIEAGLYDRMSFAFTVTKDNYTEEALDNGDVIITRSILEVGKVYDISVVDFPANPNTDISARSKSAIDGLLNSLEVERLHKLNIDNKRKEISEQVSRILGV